MGMEVYLEDEDEEYHQLLVKIISEIDISIVGGCIHVQHNEILDDTRVFEIEGLTKASIDNMKVYCSEDQQSLSKEMVIAFTKSLEAVEKYNH